MAYQLRSERDAQVRKYPAPNGAGKPKPPKFHTDTVPPQLGARTRMLALIFSLIGLAAFVVPFISTQPVALGRTEWSPFLVLVGTFSGSLPVIHPTDPQALHELHRMMLGDSILFGTVCIFVCLVVVLTSAMRNASRMVITSASAIGLFSALIEMRGYPDFQLAIFGAKHTANSPYVSGFRFCLVLLAVMGLLLMISTVKELEGDSSH